MAADKFKAFQHFLFKVFPSWGTFTKDYEKEDNKKPKEEQKKSKSIRFEGYQKLCLFGLGSMFWGSVTGILADIGQKGGNPGWIDFCFIYSDIALVLMLLGLAASTFPESSWLAPSMSGLGGLQAFIFVMGSFHIGSLKYHSHIDECLYSMIGCTVIISIYWGLSIQDPLLLHILTKLVIWVIGMMVYAVGFVLYFICRFVMWAIHWLGELCSAFWKYLWSGEESLKNGLVAWYKKPREYEPLSP